MSHIDICGLSGSTIFLALYLINGAIFNKKVTEHKMCVLIFFTTASKENMAINTPAEVRQVIKRCSQGDEVQKLNNAIHSSLHPYVFPQLNH